MLATNRSIQTSARPTQDVIDSAWSGRTSLSRCRSHAIYDLVKRAIDIGGAALLLLLLTPLFALIYLAIRLTSSGPAIFRQLRLTQHGRAFTMFKFRTMYTDAENVTGPVWASASDPRVTPVGKLLRLSRLDELPQLLNVVRGEMSLIGPRPERPEIAARLSSDLPRFGRRMEVKAGITGLAQVASGYAFSLRGYRKKLLLDIMYVENRCLLLDMRIAFKTIVVILTGTGAR